MRILLDESLPRRLARAFSSHDVATVFDQGWAGLTNGRLLAAAEAEFDVFVTADQNLQYQQNLSGASIAVVVLRARTNRLDDLLPLVPVAEEMIGEIENGEVRVVSETGRGTS